MAALIEINTDGLAKLAETISFALGGTARGEIKMADAKAYASELEAKTKNKVALIKAQGEDELANYVAAKESRKLRNTVAVIEKAQSHFTEGEKVSDEPVDEGWKNRFFNIVEEICDDELREIWGRVLAGEIKKPKSYSLRTLETLRNLAKEEAAIIVKAASFSIKNEYIYKNSSLSLPEKLLLQEIGLMLDDGIGINYSFEVKAKSEELVVIDDNTVFKLYNDSDNILKIEVEIYKLSTAGKEILKLVSVDEVIRESFYKTLADHYHSKGITHISRHKITSINHSQVSYLTNGEDM